MCEQEYVSLTPQRMGAYVRTYVCVGVCVCVCVCVCVRTSLRTQDRLVVRLCEFWAASGPRGPELRPVVRMALAAVGRGGQGDVGQRVRDEILVVQQKNNCKVRAIRYKMILNCAVLCRTAVLQYAHTYVLKKHTTLSIGICCGKP